jgi:hypothetical protein
MKMKIIEIIKLVPQLLMLYTMITNDGLDTAEKIKAFAAEIINLLEKAVKNSANQVDDAIIAFCKRILEDSGFLKIIMDAINGKLSADRGASEGVIISEAEWNIANELSGWATWRKANECFR